MNDEMLQPPDFPRLFLVASGQMGYFTTAQAQEHGVSRMLLHHHLKSGRVLRAYRGVYRFRDYPPQPREEIAAALLAVGTDEAVVSHESALDILEISDIIPNKIEITIPRSRRYLRSPQGITIHTASEPPEPHEVVEWDGIRITSPARTLVDVAEAGISPEHVERAVSEALGRGIMWEWQLREAAERRSQRVRQVIDQAIAVAMP